MNTLKVGLFYGSSTCYTEMAAEKIAAAFPYNVELFNVADTHVDQLALFDLIIAGIPTWDYGELQEDWENIWTELGELDLNGKMTACFGLGDQIGYPQWFQDALGYLHDRLQAQGATMLGYWPTDEYEFTESQALTEDGKHFVGLALDDENQFELTEQRIESWVAQVMAEIKALS